MQLTVYFWHTNSHFCFFLQLFLLWISAYMLTFIAISSFFSGSFFRWFSAKLDYFAIELWLHTHVLQLFLLHSFILDFCTYVLVFPKKMWSLRFWWWCFRIVFEAIESILSKKLKQNATLSSPKCKRWSAVVGWLDVCEFVFQLLLKYAS